MLITWSDYPPTGQSIKATVPKTPVRAEYAQQACDVAVELTCS